METKEEIKDIERLYAETVHRVERGGIIKGKVVAVKSDGIVVDVGYKSEGIIPTSEFTEDEIANLKEGSDIEVCVEKINDREGVVTISRERASRMRAWESLIAAYSTNSIVEGKAVGKIKGGLMVEITGIKAFLPASQIDIKLVKDLDSFIGQTMPLRILRFNTAKGYPNVLSGQNSGTSLVVSRRSIIEEQRGRKKEEAVKKLKVGSAVNGIVKNITDYGVFVDLGGIDGLLHISDISWRRVNHPSEFFSLGDENEFVVLKYDEVAEKVTLGYKQRKADPWLSVDEKYKPGMVVKGRVVNIADYGIFVEIEEGLEGLVHVSELEWSAKAKHPSKYAGLGDEIEAMVIHANRDERRLSLSLRQLKPKPWELIGDRYKIGQKIVGRVKTLADFGAFIRLPEGVDGLIHISDLSWTRHIKHPAELLKKGQKVEAVILNLEPDKERMALGIKQLTPDPWQSEIPAKFKLGDELRGKVLKNTDFGIFVELDGGVEGLVYSSEMDSSKEVKEGGEILVRIINMNIEDRKIGLSMKNLKTAPQEE
ncbi:MAG: 30S ribosomal protein S1 [Thermodesulfovibrionales bacterium]|nr:30S ribosomal protein S1 [Thermodesulfovibrionales bacterium]